MGQGEKRDGARGEVHLGRFQELDEALVACVAERRRTDSLAPLTIVVGSAALCTQVGDLLVRRLGALANVRIVTLARFALDAVDRPSTGLQLISRQVRERLVRRLVARPASPLAYFGRVADRPHFARALAGTFTDLREARVPAGSGWAARACAPAARTRAADLEALYAAYCRELDRLGLADDAAVFLRAAVAVADGGLRGLVILFGLYDLNAAQEALVAAVLRAGADVFVPSPTGADDDLPMVALADAACLAGRVHEAEAAANDLGAVSALWSAGSTPARRLGELATHAPRSTGSTSPRARPFVGDGSLAVVSVPDERAEAREAAREVLAAVEKGAALWDCAVIAPRAEAVERLAAALEVAGLSVAAPRPDRSPGPRILTRLLDCLAPPAGRPLGRREVVALLTCAPLREPAAPKEAARWLDEARRAGVVAGGEQWRDRLGRRVLGLERRVAELEAAHETAVEPDEDGGEPLALARQRLAASRALAAPVAVLAGQVARLPQLATWRTWRDSLARLSDDIFAPTEAAAAREAVAPLADFDVLADEVGLTEVAAALRDVLSAAAVSSGRVGRDGVAVLTPLGLRGLRFHTVVFTGLAEGGFPVPGRPDPVLGDAERRRVGDALHTRLPLAETRDAESLLVFAFACEAARERLVLLAPRTDAATGRPRLPSRLLLRLAALATGSQVGLDEFLSGRPLAPVWRRGGGAPSSTARELVWVDERERDEATLLELSADRRWSAAGGYLAEVLGARAEAERRLGVWRSARSLEPTAWDAVLHGEARDALVARHPFAGEMHPTRLERYLTCPFAFLLRDVLGLEAPDEPDDGLDMDPRAFGSLAHEILRRTYAAVIDAEGGLDEARAALDEAWQAASAEAERRGVTGAPLSWEVRRDALLEDLREVVSRDRVFAGDGRPVAVEWPFGEAEGRPVAILLEDGRRVCFAGRLDRVDAIARGARVIDYKTSRGDAERRRVARGLSVQLPVYQLAVRQAGGPGYAEVDALYRLVTRRGGFTDVPLADDEPEARERLARLITATVVLVDAGMFPRSTAGMCDYCDVRYACGVSAWTRARKRRHDDFDALVALQSKGPEE